MPDVTRGGDHAAQHPEKKAPSHPRPDDRAARPVASAPAPPPPPRLDPEVLSKQRLLRAKGFNVVVDGIWGPASQAAWDAMQRGAARPSVRTDAHDRVDPARAAALHHQQQVAGAARADAARHIALVKEHAAILTAQRAVQSITRSNPAHPSEAHAQTANAAVTLGHRLDSERRDTAVATAAAKATALKFAATARTKPASALTSHELIAITVDPLTGRFDPQNRHDVILVQTWLKTHGQPDLVVDGTYGPKTNQAFLKGIRDFHAAEQHRAQKALVTALYEPGIIKAGAPDFPLLGTTPSPGELLHLLQGGGFTASLVAKALARRAASSPSAMLAWKEAAFRRLARDAGFNAFLERGPGHLPEQFVRVLSMVPGSPESSGVLGDTAQQQILALANSRAPDHFQRQLLNIAISDEQRYRESFLVQASGRGFWGAALHVISIPGEYTRQGLATGYQVYRDAWSDPQGSLSPKAGIPDAPHPYQEAHDRLAKFAAQHPWYNAAFVTIVDPLWLTGGAPEAILKGAVIGTARGALSLERVGVIIDDAAAIKIKSDRLFKVVAPAASFARGGLGLPVAHYELGKSAALALAHDVPVARHIYQGVGMATRAKNASISAAKNRVRIAMRHGFAPAPGLEVDEIAHSSDVAAGVDHFSPRFHQSVIRHFPELVDHLHKAGVSLYANRARHIESEFGGQLLARMAESFRGMRLQALARSRRSAMYQRMVEADGDIGAAHVAADAEYRDVIAKGGSYLFGASDPEIDAILRQATERDIDLLAGPVFEKLQTHLEDLAETAGRPLFDATDNFAEAGSESYTLLRGVARDAYEKTITVRNPLFGRFLSSEDVQGYVDERIARSVRHIRGTAARQRAAGLSFTDDKIDSLITTAIHDAETDWIPDAVGGRGYTPAKSEYEVPTIYARHVDAIYGAAARGMHPILAAADVPPEVRRILSQLATVSADPAGAADLAFEQNVDKLAWAITGQSPLRAEELASAPSIRGVARDTDAASEAASFNGDLHDYAAWLDAAKDEMLPKMLFREFAWWQALHEAQSAPLRFLYQGMSGWLQVWTTLTLPARPGFVVRNVVDNVAKMLVQGAQDPRFYFYLPSAGVRSIFELDLRAMRYALSIGGRYQGNRAVHFFDGLIESFMQHSNEVLKKIWEAHGIPVPESAIEGMRSVKQILSESVHLRDLSETDALNAAGKSVRHEPLQQPLVTRFAKARDSLWELMATKPENAAKRQLYRKAYAQALREGKSDREAFLSAIDAIEHTLFDYSKLSTIEDNMKWLFPFVQYWRKTTQFWMTEAFSKPWLPAEFALSEDRLRHDIHGEWPEWMQRYVDSNPITDLLSSVPGLDYLVPGLSGMDAMTDPATFLSFSPIYKTFQGSLGGENESLPADKKGWRFVSTFVDAINDWGLSLNPAVRKPAEIAGVFNFRAWQTMFPQTSIAEAFTREFMTKSFPNGINVEAMLEDKFLGAIGSDFSVSDTIAARFDYFVQSEIAAQVARGEPTNRALAEEKIRGYFYAQAVVGYATGMYVRTMDPASFHLYQIAEALRDQTLDFRKLSAKDQRAYRIFSRRKLPALEFNRYVDALPSVEAYYAIGDYAKAQQFKQDHPEIVQYVEKAWGDHPVYSKHFAAHAALIVDTKAAIELTKLFDAADLSRDVRQLAHQALVTPELSAFWRENDTARDVRDRHLRGLYYRFLARLNDTFHAYPETDYKARQGFLKQHPILEHWWAMNNHQSDDLRSVVNATNATLRERYFEYVDGGDWNGAHSFLRTFPFMFEFTKAASKVTPDGEWVRKGGGKFHRTQHSIDYLAARGALRIFFGLPVSTRSAWLHGNSPEARIVRGYLAKYGHPHGPSQHATDYLAAKSQLQHYFDLQKHDKNAASEWLHAGSKDALAVLAYFKKWGKMNKQARNWSKLPASKNPDVDNRMRFWKRYWMLPPDERPGFVIGHADSAGVFVYGKLGMQERADAEAKYLRDALAHGFTRRAALYMRVKPLVELFFHLKKDEKALVLRANPDLAAYLDEFSHPKFTGNKALDHKIETYFHLPEGSPERVSWLVKHHDVQRYLDKKSGDAAGPIHRVLETYFNLPPDQRRGFSIQHPEISEYFLKRRQESDNERAAAQVFDDNDPRLDARREHALRDITIPGRLKQSQLQVGTKANELQVARRLDRQPTVT